MRYKFLGVILGNMVGYCYYYDLLIIVGYEEIELRLVVINYFKLS